MRRELLKLSLCALAMACGLPREAAAQPPPSLVFAVITTTTVDETRAAWEPFFAEMRSATGLDVQGYYAPTYGSAIDALVANRAQLAWLSNKAALDCIEKANVEVFGQLVDSGGSPGYRSLIIARRDSPIASLEQLLSRPKTYGFAMGEVSSTSGHAMPSYALFVPRGIHPEEFFVPFVRGTHAQTLDALLRGQVHAATYNTEELQRLKATQPARAASLRVLWESALIPKDPLLWRKDLPCRRARGCRISCSATANRPPKKPASSRCSTWPASSRRTTSSSSSSSRSRTSSSAPKCCSTPISPKPRKTSACSTCATATAGLPGRYSPFQTYPRE